MGGNFCAGVRSVGGDSCDGVTGGVALVMDAIGDAAAGNFFVLDF